MKALYCENCQKFTGFKRNLGIGTIIMIIITAGFWILLLPFYPKRCHICGLDFDRIRKNKFAKIFGVITFSFLAILFLIILIQAW